MVEYKCDSKLYSVKKYTSWVEVYLFALHKSFLQDISMFCVAAKRKSTFLSGVIRFAGGTFLFTGGFL